jgi:hypothetical protein
LDVSAAGVSEVVLGVELGPSWSNGWRYEFLDLSMDKKNVEICSKKPTNTSEDFTNI